MPMDMPNNRFKSELLADNDTSGLWVSLADPIAAEIGAGAGFDWLVLDGEHSPNDLRTILGQLQAVQAYPVSVIVRPVEGDRAIIKQLLDVGVQTILAPMVESAEQAVALVESVRYPPAGRRGVATARAARWGRVENYWEQADSQMCVIAQIESQDGLDNLEAIAAVEGIDALFVGPSDLGASLGYLGQPDHPVVRAAVADALTRSVAAGCKAGVLALTKELVDEYREAGASFVGVAIDTAILAKGTADLARQFDTDEG